jgi:DNA-binding transcriptional MerR regulator
MGASAILKLQAAGFSTEQVSALAELIDSQAATKADLEAAKHGLDAKIDALRGDLETAKHELGSKIDGLDHRLDAKIDAVEHRLDMKIGRIEGDNVLLKWMLGFVLAFNVAFFFKLFLR